MGTQGTRRNATLQINWSAVWLTGKRRSNGIDYPDWLSSQATRLRPECQSGPCARVYFFLLLFL